MPGLNIDFCLSICRMEARFADDIGNFKTISGTGFWMSSPCDKVVFVTNQHNLVLGYYKEEYKNYYLKKIEIELRDYSVNKFYPIPKMLSLSSYEFILSPNADVAIIYDMSFVEPIDNFSSIKLNALLWLADDSFFHNYCGITQEVSFLGFPHGKYDEEGNLPIAGDAIFASIPNRSFKNQHIKTDDIILVDGRSFKGSSGSPVVTFPRGLSIRVDKGGPVNTEDYCPQKIVGIMSGHLYLDGKWIADIDQKREDFLNHSGKSYFTRSTSILGLFDVLNSKKKECGYPG
jgi:hypothetical protein